MKRASKNFKKFQRFFRSLIRASQEISPMSKCTKDAENVYTPLVTVYHNGSTDTTFDPPPPYSLDSTFHEYKNYIAIV